jgi:undecaprenyl-phosphate 4-deoxy-4-formamido-L-arabinose transferase
MKKIKISIVIPVYNSSDIIDNLIHRIQKDLKKYLNFLEVVLVDDFSRDNSWHKINILCKKNKFIKGIKLKDNFGQHNAIMAGLNNCRGDYIILMDDDLQHSPKFIPNILDQLKSSDVCYVTYIDRKHESWKKFVSWLNNIVSSVILQKPLRVYLSSFKGLKKNIVNEMIRHKNNKVYLDWLILKQKKKTSVIPISHFKRFSGNSNYNFSKLIVLWSQMVFSVPVYPLRYSSIVIIFSKFILNLFFKKIIRKNNKKNQYIISKII